MVIFKSCIIDCNPNDHLSLHSNMVIFKCILCYRNELIWKCLHSNMVIFKLFHIFPLYTLFLGLHSNMVIFKSISRPTSAWIYNYVYIPIWLYSNAARMCAMLTLESLHSNMVIFKSYPLFNLNISSLLSTFFVDLILSITILQYFL